MRNEIDSERPQKRGFLRAIVFILDILSGAEPLIVDVRQTGSGPVFVLLVPHIRLARQRPVDGLASLFERRRFEGTWVVISLF
jgi:hypothetical protein